MTPRSRPARCSPIATASFDRSGAAAWVSSIRPTIDLRLGQQVALKFLPPSLAGDPRRLAQFHNEVSLARQVSHPNVCRVYDIGDLDGHLFLTMEYIEGEDLAATLRRRGPFSEQEGVELARQICAGLAAVQARGILHRDLKPANIMRNKDGHPQLMDFGIAAAGAVDDAERISEGTPAYMAPEQLARAEVTAQSDVYALGLVMHEIFTGQRPGVGGVASSGWPRCHGAPQSSARHPAVHGSRSVAASRKRRRPLRRAFKPCFSTPQRPGVESCRSASNWRSRRSSSSA